MYARGCIVGLTRGTRREHIIRAAQESIAYQVADLVEAMEKDTGLSLAALKADGGASRDSFLMQFRRIFSIKKSAARWFGRRRLWAQRTLRAWPQASGKTGRRSKSSGPATCATRRRWRRSAAARCWPAGTRAVGRSRSWAEP